MNNISLPKIHSTNYDKNECEIGVVHVGFGAFHRAHQAVYIDDYMSHTNDLRWGIAAVNLRESESTHFEKTVKEIKANDGYLIKSYSSDGQDSVRIVRSHIGFYDWTRDIENTQNLLALETVHLVTITVTESGYYTNAHGQLDINDPVIIDEINNSNSKTIYAYLRNSINKRMMAHGKPITIACCDNIRQNGLMLKQNLISYLKACGDQLVLEWVQQNAYFPCSMVDRITLIFNWT
jgi:mannitol-1-phosphate/altronate dehydrogenase